MKVALVHDDLVQWGGAERMLLGLSEIFPDTPIYTSVFDYNNSDLLKNFKGKKIYTSFLQKIPAWRWFYKALLPLYPLAFEQFDFSTFDLVISQSTRFAKSIITKPNTRHICYCHTPPRFLWDSNINGYKFIKPILYCLRVYDFITSARVDHFIAGSQSAKRKIKKIYKRDSRVIYPFVDIDRFSGIESFDGGYFVVISRLNKYKKVDLAIEACAKLNLPLKVIGNGPQFESLRNLADKLNAKVDFLGNISDGLVNQVLAGAKALIICAREDFGITALEAQALGKPVIAYKAGGVLETVTDGKTGFLFNNQTSKSLVEVLEKCDLNKINPNSCKLNASSFSKEKFIESWKTKVFNLKWKQLN